ncbi:MAG: hypothetical protein GON13_02295 [Nanoarchaeota archaeon]|nr:hypothetical protein [Nanoarchaeota archaeon]
MKRSLFIFLSSVLLGLFFPQLAPYLSSFTTLFLIVLMVFSLKNAKFEKVDREDFGRVQWLFLVSLFSGLVLAFFSSFFISDLEVFSGLLLWCLMPPAVSVIAMSFILKSDVGGALLAEAVSYLVYLIVSPILVFLFLGESISVSLLFVQLLLVIVLPLIVAYFVRNVNTDKYNKLVIELCLALIFYVVIGKNSFFIFSEPALFVLLVGISLVYRFGFFAFFSKIVKTKLTDEKLFVLFSTMKNTGIASVVALSFLSNRALLALGANILVLPFFMVFLEEYYLRKK